LQFWFYIKFDILPFFFLGYMNDVTSVIGELDLPLSTALQPITRDKLARISLYDERNKTSVEHQLPIATNKLF